MRSEKLDVDYNFTSVPSNSIWIPIPAQKFGIKCAMSRHDECKDGNCKCLCHDIV